jgi:hypothetical protein
MIQKLYREWKWAMVCILVGLAPLCAGAASAQRIRVAIDPSRLTTLHGNVSPHLRASQDLGVAPFGQVFEHVFLILDRGAEQDKALTSYLAQLQKKSSSNYHRWLTPDQYGEQYGVAQGDINKLSTWLESMDLKVNSVSKSRMTIDFSGTAAQLQSAFHVTLHEFSSDGDKFFANTTDPQIPSAIAGVVKGVARMNTKPLHSHARLAGMGKYDADTKKMVALSSAPSLHADMTYTTSSGKYLFATPADAATIYDTPNTTLNANYTGTTYDGTGVTIGVGGDSNIDSSYPVNYRKLFLGDSTAPVVTVVGTDPGITTDVTESYLDLEVSGGLAPGATIHYYPSSDLVSGIQQALDDNLVDIFSLSFGECELALGASGNAEFYAFWQQAAAQGIAVAVSTGDNGTAGCDDDNTEYEAVYGLQVSGLASTPYNIAVGGTDYDILSTDFSTYVGSTNSKANYYRTAMSYIPENPWNDSTAVNGLLADNTYYLSSGETNIVGGSGGRSACVTDDSSGNCSAGYAKPGWQRGTTLPGDGVRDQPDVSLLAANGSYGATWLLCSPITSGSSIITGCDTSASSFYYSGVGGTSASTPAFAGILALVQQAAGSRLGQVAQTLYTLASSAHGSSIFHDTTVGNNSVVCTEGDTDCTIDAAGDYFLPGYDAGTGYDMASGLGSVDTTQLISNWSSAGTALVPSVTITPSSTTLVSGGSLDVAVAVSGSGATPGGTITLVSGSYTSSPIVLTGGSVSFTIPSGDLINGTDTVSANYSGDANYESASASTSIVVSKTASTATVTPSSTAVTATGSLNVTVVLSGPGRAPTGTVTLSGGSYTSTGTLVDSSVTFSIPAGDLLPGSNILTATYSGDSYYLGSSGTTTVVVNGAQASVALAPASTSFYTGQAVSVSIGVTGTGTTPTGTVALVGGGYTAAAVALSGGTATVIIPANSLSAGVVSLTATYSGDSYYQASIVSTPVTVAASTFTVAGPSGGITASSKGTAATGSITVSSTNGYNGPVNLTCSLTGSPSAADATYIPTCSIESPVTLSSTAATGTATLTISSTARTTAALVEGAFSWKHGSAAVLAMLFFFFGVPARRRSWMRAGRGTALLGLIALVAVCGLFSGCGGSTKTPIAGTTSGAYTFTVTATDSTNSSVVSTATVTATIP